MLSRVAEAIYWMNRYIERAENVARFAHVTLHLELDVPVFDDGTGSTDQGAWQPLVWTTGDEKRFMAKYDTFSKENVMHFLTFDEENPNSIASCIKLARENARSIREVISSEMWFTLNRFYLMVRDSAAPRHAAEDPHSFYTEIKTFCALFIGETMTTMSHNEGWHFGTVGRLLERADKTSRILDVKYYILLPRVDLVGMPLDTLQWVALLKSASAFEMYRKAYNAITPKNVSRFLLLDEEFPRSVLYCIVGAEESIRSITGTSKGKSSNDAEKKLAEMHADLSNAKIDSIIRTGLHEYVDSLQTRINRADDAIFHTFFEMLPEAATTPSTQAQ